MTSTTKRSVEGIYPPSPSQQGMLFHSLYAPESGVYVEQLSCILRGELDIPACEQAWQLVVDRHSALRTAFAWKSTNKTLQVVQRHVAIPLRQEDWRGLPADGRLRNYRARPGEFLRAPESTALNETPCAA